MAFVEEKIIPAILSMIRSRRERRAPSVDVASSSPQASLPPAKLRAVRFSDFAGVSALKERWGMDHDSPENWERLWRHNPALAQVENPPSMGWVLEAGDAIVGYFGNITLLYRYGGRTITAAAAHGFVVDSPYRAVGVSLASAFFRQKSVDLYISTSAIEAVGKIAAAFKSLPVPQPEYDTAMFWVLRPYSFARALMKQLEIAPAFSPLGAVLTSLAIGTDKLLRRRWPVTPAGSFSIREIEPHEIGDEFQSLWEEKMNERPRLFADRTPATLRWHFQISGDRGSARVLCCYESGRLAGYAVVRSDTNPQTSLRTSVLADIVARADRPEIVQALWAAAYDHAKRIGSDTLEVLGFPPALRAVGARWHPYLRKYPSCPFYYKAAEPWLQEILADPNAWYASPYDGDATLIRPSYSTVAAAAGSQPLSTFNVASRAVENCAADQPTAEETKVS